jgi:nucleoside-diphosphate-sugar epimerase
VSHKVGPEDGVCGQRVIVMGAAGFVGNQVVRQLLQAGAIAHPVVSPWSDPWRLDDVLEDVALHRVDVRDRDRLDRLLSKVRPDYVVNAVRYRDDSRAGRRAMFETLVTGTQNLLGSAAASACRRFVQLGSSAEYGARETPMDETMAPSPTTAFGKAKVRASMLCLAAGRNAEMATVVLRPFMVYGPRDVPTRLVPTAIRAALTGAELALTPPGQRRDWVFVSDVGDGCLRALGGGADGEIVNLGTGTEHANEEVVDIVARASGRRMKLNVGALAPRAWDTRRWVAATEKARSLLGWEASTPLEAGIRQTLSWAEATIQSLVA